MQINTLALKPPYMYKRENLKIMANNDRIISFNKQNNKENIEFSQNKKNINSINNININRNIDLTKITDNFRNIDENRRRSSSNLKSSNGQKSIATLPNQNSIFISNVHHNRSKSNFRSYHTSIQENEPTMTNEPFKARKAPNMQVPFQIYKSKMPLTIPSGFKITDHMSYK